MPDPSRLRDSTQIVLPSEVLADIREDLTAKFTLTIFEMSETMGEGSPADGRETVIGTEASDEQAGSDAGTTDANYVRIIGSPAEIKAASDFLSRRGVSLR